MKDLTANRLAGALAVLWLPLLIIGFGLIVGFSPGISDPESETVEFYATVGQERAWVGEAIEATSFLCLLAFVARVASVARRTSSVADWFGTLAVALAAASAAIAAAGIAPLVALARSGAAAELPPSVVVLFNNLRIGLHWLDMLVFGIMFVVLGALLLQARMLPRWLAWAAIVLGLVQFASVVGLLFEVADTVSLLLGLWAIITGVLIIIRPSALMSEDSVHRPSLTHTSADKPNHPL